MISICSLIYKSPAYADFVWESAHKHTPHLHDGRAYFFFVANDPTPALEEHLFIKGYRFVKQINTVLTPEQLNAHGYVQPEYIRRVYQGWNRAILESDEQMCLVNSDMAFSPGWLDALLAHYAEDRIVCPQLVERRHPKHGTFPTAYEADFGSHPRNFNEPGFLAFAAEKRKPGLMDGGSYIPMMSRRRAIEAGLYPEGNRPSGYGDQILFKRLAEMGSKHVTVLDSILYHFKEGEMDE